MASDVDKPRFIDLEKEAPITIPSEHNEKSHLKSAVK